MPYFNIAYLTESDRCGCVLAQADSLEAARDAFQARNPDIQIVSVWERPDFVPVRSNTAPASTAADRVAAFQKRLAALEKKLQNGNGMVIVQKNAGQVLDCSVALDDTGNTKQSAPPSPEAGNKTEELLYEQLALLIKESGACGSTEELVALNREIRETALILQRYF